MSETNHSPRVTDADIHWLEKTLRFAEAWLHADELLLAHTDAVDYAGKRWIRAVASQSNWVISGNEGYKHVACATREEVQHFVDRMNSQIEVMRKRTAAVQVNKASLN